MQLSPASGDQRSSDRDAIRAHIDKIFQAYIQKNADVIRATHANEWTGFQSSSRTTIHGIDQFMKDVDGYIHSPVKMTAYKMLEFDVVFYGNVGIVTYIADVTYDYQGQSSTRKLRVLDVYAKLADGWNQVGSDTTLHPDTLAAELQQSQSVDADGKQELLAAREAVWRAWFANDGPRLAELVPPELIAIEQSEKWGEPRRSPRRRQGFCRQGRQARASGIPADGSASVRINGHPLFEICLRNRNRRQAFNTIGARHGNVCQPPGQVGQRRLAPGFRQLIVRGFCSVTTLVAGE
jgi:ketosteroid isomerase-like protein